MKHIPTYEEFLTESKKEKMSGATYWEEVNIPGVGNSNTVKADNDATKAAQALVTVWEKGKKFDDFTVSADDIKKLTNIANAKANEVITIKLVDGKADKDYQIKMEMRDTALGVPKKNVYTWVTRVG